MSPRYTNTHNARVADTARLFTSPEAIKARASDDALVKEIYELGYIDHLLGGFKHLTDRGIDGRTNRPHTTLGLGTDDPAVMSQAEQNQMQINEVKNALSGNEIIDSYANQINPEEAAYIKGLIAKHVLGTDRAKVGGLGTANRLYPSEHPLAGEVIPVDMTPGDRYDRADKIFLDVAGMVDPDTGAQLTGNELDAMHREPAAERPDLIAVPSNIKMGGKSMNQSDGRRQGDALADSRRTRLVRLQGERFLDENDIPAKQRGGVDTITNRENRIANKMTRQELLDDYVVRQALEKEADAILDELRGGRFAGDVMMPYISQGRRDSPGSSKVVIVDAGPGSYVRVNGNGKKAA